MSTMYKYTCQYCNSSFESRRNPQWMKTPNFCSKQCADDARRKHPKKNCIICGKVFQASKLKKKHCSKECSYVSHRKKGIINCEICKKPFKRRRVGHRFCSSECYGKTMLGSNPREGKEFSKAIRIAIKNRDKFTCVQCGSTKKIEIDHIIPIGLGGDNSMANGQVLCHKCHREKTLLDRHQMLSHNML